MQERQGSLPATPVTRPRKTALGRARHRCAWPGITCRGGSNTALAIALPGILRASLAPPAARLMQR
jgi:hypothetical protein